MVLSAAVDVARTRSEPPSRMEPANTWSPGVFATGTDSPVTGAWFARRAALDDHAVDRGALARPQHEHVAGTHVGGGQTLLDAAADDRALGWRELHEAADGAPRALQRGDLQHRSEAEEEDDQAGLRPLTDGRGADGGQGHEHVHVHLARAQAEEGGARHERAAAHHRRGEEPWREGGRHGLGSEAGEHEGAGDEREQRARLAEPEAATGAAPASAPSGSSPRATLRPCARRCRSRGGARRGTRRARRRSQGR